MMNVVNNIMRFPTDSETKRTTHRKRSGRSKSVMEVKTNELSDVESKQIISILRLTYYTF